MKHSVENVFTKKWMKRLFSTALVLLAISGWSQQLPLDSWRVHFSYNSISKMVEGNGKIFAAAENGLFYIDTTTGDVNTLTKIDGLSDADISALWYDEQAKALIIGYESGLIDVHSQGKVTTIRDLSESLLVGNKKVFDITSDGTNAYLGTNFGVIVVSLDRKEITDNFRSIGEQGEDITVKELKVINERLFVLSDSRIQSGLLQKNLLDFNNWELIEASAINLRSLTVGDQLYAVQDDTSVVAISLSENIQPIFSNSFLIRDLTFDQNLIGLIGNEVINLRSSEKTFLPEGIVANSLLSSKGFWIGTNQSGILSPSGEHILPNGPQADQMSNISYTNGNLYAFYGPKAETYIDQIDSLGFSVFDNSSWSQEQIPGFYNMTDGQYFNGHMIYSSAGYGLYDMSINDTISGLTKTDEGRLIIPSLTVANGQLFATSFDNNVALYTWDKDNLLTSYTNGQLGTRFPIDINVSRFDSYWVTRSSFDGGGFIVRDFANDERRLITISDGIPSNQVNGLAIDLGDEAWVATNAGPAIFSDASFVFNNQDAIEPIYENQLLLEGEEIFAIAVDGGNRIWMGAESGLYIFDNVLNNLEHHFTTENSALLSHTIYDFEYNPSSGEMFMLTDKGLISYRSNSSIGQSTSQQAKIFPNPVRPGYSGLVGITNLSRDASVKITDVNGKLMQSIKANGGTASWDLLDYNGQRVASGVYIVLTSTRDGLDTVIGKIAVVN
ncbi:MAG: T9SS type A sorting domain-containing protein [Cyclobacteriaceae bacterium]